MIDITGVNLVVFVKKVYELSVPQGLGVLHFKEGGLSDEEAKAIVSRGQINMDYVHGRACKMNVFFKEGKWYISDRWYDHTNEQLRELLLSTFPKDKPLSVGFEKEHIVSCNCAECQKKRR